MRGQFAVFAICLAGALGACADTRDAYQAVVAKESAKAADDWGETTEWGYCKSVSLGHMWRKCGYDLTSACWQNRANTCAGVPQAAPIELGAPGE